MIARCAAELVRGALDRQDVDAADAWVSEIDCRARRVLADPHGGEDRSSARMEIESKLRRP